MLTQCAVTLCCKKFPHTVVFRRLEQCNIYCKYRSWRPRLVALLRAVRLFSLATCPRACCLAPTRVLLPNAACTYPCLSLPVHGIEASLLTLTLTSRYNLSGIGQFFPFPRLVNRSSIKRVISFRPIIAEPKRSAFTLTHVLQACRRFFG